MNIAQVFVRVSRRRMRVATPKALSLLALVSLLAIALMLPDGSRDRHVTAAEVAPVAIDPAKAQRPITLRDRLVVGLQARLKSEVEFIENVVFRVRTGQLPQRLVDETFFWARQRAADKRNSHARRAIIYFQPAMRLRAEKLNVPL
jgi:hypothetical protein